MNKYVIFLFFFLSLFFFSQLMVQQDYAQYCFPIPPYCNAGQSCSGNTCFGVTCVNCPGGCNVGTGLCNSTYKISGTVYVDTNGNGSQDGGENGYNGATVNVGGIDQTTNATGSYSRTSMSSGIYSVTLTVPGGYQATTANPRSVSLGPDTIVNFGIQLIPPPVCVGGMSSSSGIVAAGQTSTLSVASCTNNSTPPPSPFTWNPDTSGTCTGASYSGQTDTPTSSTTTWSAPSCPVADLTCTPRVAVTGPGGTTNYTTTILVPATYTVDVNVRSVSSTGSCTPTDGVSFNDGVGGGARLNLNGGSVNQNLITNPANGQASFTCISGGNYQLTLSVPSGYTLTGTALNGAQSVPGHNPINFNPLLSNVITTFCIAPINPWFQTDKGDARFLNLTNPIPVNRLGSTDATYPGIFYSSNSNVNVGYGNVSAKNWYINNEYSYNSNTQNRNGGMSYDFYKSKTSQLATNVTTIATGTFDQAEITGSGAYEAPGDLTINSYNHVNGRRVVLLVNGNVTINTPITIPQNQGIFILAAKGNITVAKTVGVSYNTDYVLGTANTHSLDGYYTAQGSIILDGDTCPDGSTLDLRLNVGGTLIANSLKPFSTIGTGTIQNKRSVCANNTTYPSLFIASRPDFLTQLTDFYKTSYTKWSEVNP